MVAVVGRGNRDGDTWCVKRDMACIGSPDEGNPWLGGPKVARYYPVKVLAGSSSFAHSSTVVSPSQGDRGCLRSPNLDLVERAWRRSEQVPSIWLGTISGDCRSFVQVVKIKLTPIVMVPPRPVHGWGRESFGAGRAGRGGGRVGRRGFFLIPNRLSESNARERINTTVATVVKGVIYAKQLEVEFSRILFDGWRWTTRKVGDNMYIVRFPNALLI
jgi:hypothetical protein